MVASIHNFKTVKLFVFSLCEPELHIIAFQGMVSALSCSYEKQRIVMMMITSHMFVYLLFTRQTRTLDKGAAPIRYMGGNH